MRLKQTKNYAPPPYGSSLANRLHHETIYHKMLEEVEDYAILFIDNHGIIQNWNKGAEKIKGYKAKEIVGKNFSVFYTNGDQKKKLPEKILKEARRTGRAVQEGWRVRKNGSVFWGSTVITCIHEKNNQVLGFTKVTRDLTERRNMEDGIRKAIIDTQEKERNELSEELHNNISQILATSSLFIKEASKECVNELLQKGRKNLEQALKEIRNISHRLDPSAELALGLSDAIQSLVSGMNQLNKIKFSFTRSPRKWKARPEIEKILFRIVQEQVNNIMRHSGAEKATIDLTHDKKNIRLIISDNGKGFSPAVVKKGLGLQNIILRT